MFSCPFDSVLEELAQRSWEVNTWPHTRPRPPLTELRGPLTVGRWHDETYGLIKSLGHPVSLLHFDAHVDAGEVIGQPLHHGNWITQLLDDGLLLDVYQVGLRTDIHRPFPHTEAGDGFDFLEAGLMRGPVYLTIDLDVFDPAFAPAVTTKVSGGLSPIEVHRTLARVQGLDFCGCDIMEFHPELDVGSITAALVAGLVLDLAYLLE